MLVAYSMLQMVREQALVESMSGDAILLVSALSRIPLQPPEPGACTHFVEECRDPWCASLWLLLPPERNK